MGMGEIFHQGKVTADLFCVISYLITLDTKIYFKIS